MSSRMITPRPYVPSIRSLVRSLTRMQSTITRGRLPPGKLQWRPPSNDQYNPNSVPANSRQGSAILRERTYGHAGGEIARDRRPRRTAIDRLEDVRREIVVPVAVERHVRRSRIES